MRSPCLTCVVDCVLELGWAVVWSGNKRCCWCGCCGGRSTIWGGCWDRACCCDMCWRRGSCCGWGWKDLRGGGAPGFWIRGGVGLRCWGATPPSDEEASTNVPFEGLLNIGGRLCAGGWAGLLCTVPFCTWGWVGRLWTAGWAGRLVGGCVGAICVGGRLITCVVDWAGRDTCVSGLLGADWLDVVGLSSEKSESIKRFRFCLSSVVRSLFWDRIEDWIVAGSIWGFEVWGGLFDGNMIGLSAMGFDFGFDFSVIIFSNNAGFPVFGKFGSLLTTGVIAMVAGFPEEVTSVCGSLLTRTISLLVSFFSRGRLWRGLCLPQNVLYLSITTQPTRAAQ